MLKFMYTEAGPYLEPLAEPLETWLSLRQAFAQRLGQSLLIQATTASFLLPSTLAGLAQLAATGVDLCVSDPETVEVTLLGLWITEPPANEEGLFVVALAPDIEDLLVGLWRAAQAHPSTLRGA